MNIQDAFHQFITYGRGQKNYARETVIKHEDCFRSWVLPTFGQVDIERITPVDIVRLQSGLLARGVGTARRYSVIMTMKLLFKFCRDGLKLECLDPDKEIRLPKRSAPFGQFLTNDEVNRVRDSIDIHKFAGR